MAEWFQVNFWQKLVDQTTDWVVSSGPTLVIILIGAVVVLKFVRAALGRLGHALEERAAKNAEPQEEGHKRIQTLLLIVQSTLKVAIWALVVLLVLREVGVDIAPIIAGAGILGLAVGFGGQNLVKDIISGFFILLENQIRVGDVAIINGQGGLVEYINLRTTILRDLSGVVHIFPNGSINKISNMTKDWSAMVFDIGVSYQSNVDQVMAVMKQVFDDLQADDYFGHKIVAPIEIFGLDKFDDSALIIKARIKTRPIAQWEVGREYNRRLKKAFDQAGIEIPFPQRTLHIQTPDVESLIKLYQPVQ